MKLFRGLMVGTIAATSLFAAGSVAEAKQPYPCGFYRDGANYPWYGHCDEPPPTNVQITIKLLFSPNQTWCVAPGPTKLPDIATNAWWNGKLC